MKIIARTSFVHNSPRKMRLVADVVRKMGPLEAIDYLRALPHRAAKTVLKVYQQAMGNAKNNLGMSLEGLKVLSLQIEEGPRGFKKADSHAHGARFDRGVRRKRMSHVRLELTGEGRGK